VIDHFPPLFCTYLHFTSKSGAPVWIFEVFSNEIKDLEPFFHHVLCF